MRPSGSMPPRRGELPTSIERRNGIRGMRCSSSFRPQWQVNLPPPPSPKVPHPRSLQDPPLALLFFSFSSVLLSACSEQHSPLFSESFIHSGPAFTNASFAVMVVVLPCDERLKVPQPSPLVERLTSMLSHEFFSNARKNPQ